MLAQTTASIAGVVLDQSHALIAGAKVTARHVDTGVTRSASSSSDGRFVLPALAVGEYEIRAEMPGFRALLRKGVRLTVADTAMLELKLEVGNLDQSITVTGDAPPVNTASSDLSYLVSESAIRDLPLNGRNYTDLALLQPGVVSYPHRDGGSAVAHGLATSINGQDPRSNVYLLDGTPLNDFTNGPAGSAAGTVLGMETIREFRVETNAYSAEYGRNFGGQINVLTKSGGNTAHGSLFEFLRNDNVDARNFFDPRVKPAFTRNQFGGSVSGPLRRDRTFYFVGLESLRERLGRTITSAVPDLDARRGVLPDPAKPGASITVAVHPAVRPYLDEFPLPNGGSLGRGIAEYSFLFRQRTEQDFGQGRLDHQLSPRGQVFARYTYDGGQQRLPTDFSQFPRTFVSRNQFVTAEHRHTFSARALHTLRASFSRTRIGQNVEANTSRPLDPFIVGRGLMGNIDITGLPRFGPQTSVNLSLVQNVFGVENGMVWVRGRHFLKAGSLIERYRDNMYNPTFSLGTFTFGDLRTFLENRPLRFLGLPANGALDRYWRFTLFGFYLQDDFRVHTRLTVNIGLRYEVTTTPRDLYGRDSALLQLSDPAPSTGQLYLNPSYRNFSPRAGFAWDPQGNGRTSLRGGYGLFFNTNNQQNLIVTVTNPPATPRVIIANPQFPVPSFAGGVGNSIRPVEWNIKNPYVHVWNLNVQREVWNQTVVMVGYAGSRGIHLLRSGDVNIPTPLRLADGSLFFAAGLPRPNPSFGVIELKRSDGNSWYNALLFEVRRRWSQGFDFQSSYTFSRNIDTTQASTFFSDATNGTTSAMPEFPGFHYNRGLADYHAKHNWVVHWTRDMPVAQTLQGAARVLAEGWQLSTISSMRSGSPLTVFVAANRSRSLWSPSLGPGLGFDRASLAPGRTHENAILGTPDRYFDPLAFTLPARGTLGALGRGTFIGPDLGMLDMAVVKNTRVPRLGESGVLQLRVEIFNLLNRANFGVPVLQAFDGTADVESAAASFGRIRSTITTSRQIQFGLRLRF